MRENVRLHRFNILLVFQLYQLGRANWKKRRKKMALSMMYLIWNIYLHATQLKKSNDQWWLIGSYIYGSMVFMHISECRLL